MVSVSRLGYLGIGTAKAVEWEQFATAILGLELGGRGKDGGLFLRMDDHHHRIQIHSGGTDDLAYAGWEVSDSASLRAIADQLQAVGAAVVRGTSAEAGERQVAELIKFQDPNGIALEAFCGPLVSPGSFRSPRPIAGFKTGSMGLGHVVIVVDDLEKNRSFYTEALGFRVTDYIGYEVRPGLPIKLVFMHCNQRHHSLGFLKISDAIPRRRLNHIMLELNSIDDVGATYDLCQDREIPITRTLGRHVNDHMISFYIRTPSGFDIEYGWGGRTVDDPAWRVQSYTAGSTWGHRGGLVR